MQIILLTDVYKLGEKDDVVTVKPGYANNYLFPKGMAMIANRPNLKTLEENKRQALFKRAKEKESAEQQAEILRGFNIVVETLVSKEGTIYGSVTPLQLSNIFREKGFEVDRKQIDIPDDIKSLGTYTAHVKLHKEVVVDINFDVVEKPAD